MKTTIELEPWLTPNFVGIKMPARPRQEGVSFEGSKFALNELEPEVLSDLCDEFRRNVFAKAGKPDPRAPTTL